MASIFSRFLKKKSSSVIGIDIGSSSAKIVQLRKEGGVAVLETYGELALGPYGDKEVGQAVALAPEKVAENITDLMHEANVTTTSAGIAIPFSKTLLTMVTLPRKEGVELDTMVKLEARKYVPVPMSEVQLDYFVIPDTSEAEQPSDQMRVLLVAVHNSALNTLSTIVEKTGLETSFYEIEIFSTIRSVVDEPVKPVMVIDVGAGSSKVYVVERGLVARSHAVAQGGQDVTSALATSSGISLAQAEKLKKDTGISDVAPKPYNKEAVTLTYSNIFTQARRVLSEYEREESKSVSSIILTGGGAVTKGLGTFAKSFFQHDVMLANPFQKTDAPAFMRDILKEIGPEFAVAVGIALRKLEELQ